MSKQRLFSFYYGFPISVSLAISLVVLKLFYSYKKDSGFLWILSQAQPELWVLFFVLCTFCVSHKWMRERYHLAADLISAVQTAFLLVLFLGALTSLIVYNQLGILPRLQLLNGLTWGIVEPSIVMMVNGQKLQIIGYLLATIACSYFLLRRAKWASDNTMYIVALIFLGGVFFLILTPAYSNKTDSHVRLLGAQLFDSDTDFESADPDVGTSFFQNYLITQRLNGGVVSSYRETFDSLKNKNVVLLVLESVRAKDLALFGGDLRLPNLEALSEHSILLENMYVQDPRSTKALEALDLGVFSFLGWDSYSNNLTTKFKDISLAHLVNKHGYHTSIFTNSGPLYDHNLAFSKHRGYREVRYQNTLNPNRETADDAALLSSFEQHIDGLKQPFYSMLWPIGTHHPYGKEYWTNQKNSKNAVFSLFLSEDPLAYNRYISSIKELDDFIGELIDLLKRQNVYEDTVLVMVGDHGQAFGEIEEKNLIHGSNLYEESMHIPAMIHSPLIKGRMVDKRFLSLRDVAATIYHLVTAEEFIFNNARSVFMDYLHEVPVYLSHSGAGTIGIISQGYKLRIDQNGEVFFNSIANIREDNRNELVSLTEPRQIKDTLFKRLTEWSKAMKSEEVRVSKEADR